MPNVGVFDIRKVFINLDDHQATGLDDGEVKVEKATELAKFKTGLYGDVLISVDPSRVYTFTLKLQANSPTNKWLQAKANAMRDGLPFLFRVRIVDINDTAARFTGQKAFATKLPGLARGAEATGNEWTIVVVDGDLQHQGQSSTS